jgi:hypothetical protein
MADWRAGALSGHEDYDIHDELYTPDGRCVAVLEVFTTNPTVYYCNALTPQGEHRRLGAGSDYDTTKDWAERVAGLRADVPLSGRRPEERGRA